MSQTELIGRPLAAWQCQAQPLIMPQHGGELTMPLNELGGGGKISRMRVALCGLAAAVVIVRVALLSALVSHSGLCWGRGRAWPASTRRPATVAGGHHLLHHQRR